MGYYYNINIFASDRVEVHALEKEHSFSARTKNLICEFFDNISKVLVENNISKPIRFFVVGEELSEEFADISMVTVTNGEWSSKFYKLTLE